MKKIKINLGCGKDKKHGWINVDVLPVFKPDVIHDISKKFPFRSDYADYVLAQDILEHFIYEDLDFIISEITRVLKIDGILEIRVPNLNDIFERFSDDQETRNEFIYGTTLKTGVFGAHKVGFTKPMIVALMLKHNLILKDFKEIETNFVVTFKKHKEIDKTKKLVYVNQTLGMGGAEVFMKDLLSELNNMGWKVVVYTNNIYFKKMFLKTKIKTKNISTVVDIIGDWKGLLKATVLWPKLFLEYYLIIRQEKNSSLFLMSGFIEKIIFSFLASLFSKPIVWIEFGPMKTVFDKFFQLPKILYFLVKAYPERVITSSYFSKNSLITDARISLSKLRVIACGRNLRSYKKNIKNKEVKNLVVCVSRLEQGKGQDLLVRAFAKVIKKVPTARLKIIGEGNFKKQIEIEISKYKLEKNIELSGYAEDSLEEMSKAQVVVFPSVWSMEGFGLVMIEAMGLSKPIVAFAQGPVPEVVMDRENGLLSESHDIDQLAKNIIILLNSKKTREELARKAKKTFDDKYRISIVAKKYQQIFIEAINYHKAKIICQKYL